jgi:CheY-like chemotaxis protein
MRESTDVLLVGDGPELTVAVSNALEGENELFQTVTAPSASVAADQLTGADFDCVVAESVPHKGCKLSRLLAEV